MMRFIEITLPIRKYFHIFASTNHIKASNPSLENGKLLLRHLASPRNFYNNAIES